jgi:type I restriction enzyme M protein
VVPELAEGPNEANGWDLSVKNPNSGDEVHHRTPLEILDEIAALDAESAEVLATIRGLL